MLTMNDFSVGDKVLFGRKNGEQTLAKWCARRAKLKVKQLSHGHHEGVPVGTIWTVPRRWPRRWTARPSRRPRPRRP